METIENIDVCDQLCSNATFSDTFTKKNVGFVFAKGDTPIYIQRHNDNIVLDRESFVKIGAFIQRNIAQCGLACMGKPAKVATGVAFALGDVNKPVFIYHYKMKRKGNHVQIVPIDIPSYDEFKKSIIAVGNKKVEFSD